ncbi:Rrf2 family transcriptional regulator [Sporolactobacillus terrae]|uniref:Putative HTH-type transcriptional regulator YwnA n=1 Tax=Sporolactobacillus terrae TaxID=269673 RepID=A0A410DBW1_9BACL|nr:Rrf2 family transcriptional regulator [Sporolactobacillus terrae]QAA23588.1 Rrf2 family transcriptional regulator [Sporolactobacillus terrae]QAA26558.1 Rrf2 family transcriptional regulator [Sporolactobacillus terrae]UAK15629.1 Rrf2 family transcriptional regulator [Sporolactobacillus terrae]BBO00093.1 putative HTH-type transcriptional regulator YwnA [Sporolactobacillus terrae]
MINTRVAVAIHTMALIASRPNDDLPSDDIAASVNTNPVVIRRILGMLKRAGLIRTTAGKAGASLTRDPEKISLLDVFHAVEPNGSLFAVHDNPNVHCPVGKGIRTVLDEAFGAAQHALENKLSSETLQDILHHLFDDA